MVQTHLDDLFSTIQITSNTETRASEADLTTAINQLKADLSASALYGHQRLADFSRSIRALGIDEATNYLAFRETFIEMDPSLAWVIDSGGLPYKGRTSSGGHLMGTDSAEALKDHPLYGDGVVNGQSGDDVIYGASYIDPSKRVHRSVLLGENGDDVIVDGSADGVILAGRGDDLIDGGAGNDSLRGEAGNDTYIFRRGSGGDSILDSSGSDRIWLGSFLTQDEISLSRVGDNLVLKINGTPDQLTVLTHFRSTSRQIEAIEFADGSKWDTVEISKRVLQPTDGDNILFGTQDADAIDGAGGNDIIVSRNGNDSIIGGTGDDVLYGGELYRDPQRPFIGNYWTHAKSTYHNAPGTANGNDTYIFGRGFGNDIVVDHDVTPGNQDTIALLPDTSPTDTVLTRLNNDLIVSIEGTTDTLTVRNWFKDEGADWQVENIQFADGTTWDSLYIRGAVLIGTPNSDNLYGYSTDDSIEGLAGSDRLIGGAGNDTILGSGGADSIFGGTGDDTIYGGDSVDRIYGEDGDDVLTGDAGNDILSGGSGQDSILGGDGADIIYGDGGNDYLDGGSGNDSIQGNQGNDTLIGNTGNDVLEGGVGDDILDGGAGDDQLNGGTKPYLYYYNRSYTLNSPNGDDTYLFGRGYGNDTINDRDSLSGNTDTLRFAADISPDDIKFKATREGLVATIVDTGDTVTLNNYFLDDSPEWQIERIEFADGTVLGIDDVKNIITRGTPGNDRIFGFSSADAIDSLAGDDYVVGRGGDDVIDGNTGNDELYGESGNDTLIGGEGYDRLVGGRGNDTIDGGAGDDILVGGVLSYRYSNYHPTGNNTYVFGHGYGNDTIYDTDVSATSHDVISFNADVAPDQLILRRDGDDLKISLTDSSDTLTVKFWAKDDRARIEEFRFSDGTSWDAATINQQALTGTSGNDTIFGFGSDDTINGLAGNDLLQGETGNDTYLFGRGSGQDTVVDDELVAGNQDRVLLNPDVQPADVLLRRIGSNLVVNIPDSGDSLTVKNWFVENSTNQVELVEFADGTVWGIDQIKNLVLQGTPGDDELTGYDTEDLFDGLEGNDVLSGQTGNDTYIFGRGYGQDVIRDNDATVGNVDTLRLLSDIQTSDVALKAVGYDLVLSINGSTDSIAIKNWFLDDSNKVEQLVFGDGTVWSAAEMQALASQPSSGNDYIVGTPENDVIDGGAGSDTLLGLGGDDTLIGGTENDSLYGYSGNDLLNGGAGRDYLRGDGGNDTLDGGPGNDWLYGRSGDDTYLIKVGGGFEYIEDDDGQNIVVFGEGITPDSISVQANEASFDGGEDGWESPSRIAIGIGNNEGFQFDGAEWGYGDLPSDITIDRFVFADGTELTLQDILDKADGGIIGWQEGTYQNDFLVGSVAEDEIYGNDGNDWIEARDQNDYVDGGSGADAISGGDGDDYIDGGWGSNDADIISGGLGNDQLNGGGSANNDTYLFNLGDGQDSVYDRNNSGLNLDAISFGQNINPEDVSAYISTGGNLVLNVGNAGDQITISQWFNPSTGLGENANFVVERAQFINESGFRIFNLIETIRFLDSDLKAADAANPITLFTPATEQFEIQNPTSEFGGDHAVAYAQTGDMFAVPTDYELGPGENKLIARDGDDYIEAWGGDKNINAGDGNNTVWTESGNDDITTGGGDDVISTGGGDDIVHAGAGNDEISGGPGNDVLFGEAGDDTYYYDIGDQLTTIEDLAQPGEGNKLAFGPGITPENIRLDYQGEYLLIHVNENGDTVRLSNFSSEDALGAHAVETYQFNDGRVLGYAELIGQGFDLFGTEAGEFIVGTNVEDRLLAEGGGDIIIAGKGDDILVGASGDDIYLFNLGDGVDTIVDLSSEFAGNEIAFGAGISVADLSLTADGNFLQINVGTGGDAIKLAGFDPDNARGSHGVDRFRFSDGTVLSYDQIIDLGFVLDGTANVDELNGTSATDFITGSQSNDTLTGNAGDDYYYFNLGDGSDVIDDVATFDGPNTVIFGPGISREQLTLSHDTQSGELIIQVTGTDDQLSLTGFDRNNPTGNRAVEYFEFSDGSVINYEELLSQGFDIIGTPGNDDLIGTALQDRIHGLEGNDFIVGGKGSDFVFGDAGDDTYVYNLGDGILTIDDLASIDEGNALVFGEGISLMDMQNHLSFIPPAPGDPLGTFVIRIGDGTGDEIHFTNFDPNDADLGPRAVEIYRFADGTEIDYRQLVGNTFVVQGDTGDDALSGTNVTDRLYGYEGADELHGGDGNDTLTGGTGSDDLYGEVGADAFVFNLGDGVDRIHDFFEQDNTNILTFGPGISDVDLEFHRDGNELVIDYGSGGDQIRLQDFNPESLPPEYFKGAFEFADGSSYSLNELFPIPTQGDDVLITGARNDTIDALAGDDYVNTDGGNDTLTGNLGNDTLLGGSGNDTYIFNLGDGVDTIIDTAASGEGNRIVFGPGITAADLKLSYLATTLIISVGTAGDALHLEGFDHLDAYGPHAIESFEFSDGSALSYSQLIDLGFDLVGTEGDDSITGTNTTDRILGLGGNDTIDALDGNDVIDGGTGSDTLLSGLGNDTLIGGIGNDSLTGGSGDDAYHYRLGDDLDLVQDTAGNDAIVFGDGITLDDVAVRYVDIGGVPFAQLRLLDGNGDEISDQGMDIALNSDGTLPIELAQFSDGTSTAFADLVIEKRTHYGTKKDDVIITGRHDDTIYAKKGDDIVYAGSGHDVLYGDKGKDHLYGQGGNDHLFGEKGKDSLDGGTGNDILEGGEDKDTLLGGAGNDTLYGGKGKDTLIGGAGNDRIIIGDDEDKILFGLGDGQDTITQDATGFVIDDKHHHHHHDDDHHGHHDDDDDHHKNHEKRDSAEITFGEGVSIEKLWFQQDGTNLQVSILGTNDALTIEDWYAVSADPKHKHDDFPIEEFETLSGYELEGEKVEILVQAMAAFSPQAASDGSLSAEEQAGIDAAVVMAWEYEDKHHTGSPR